MMSALTANLTVAAAVLLTGLSLLLALVGGFSWSRTRSARLAWVTLAFAAFAVQGIYLWALSYRERSSVSSGSAGPFPTLLGLDLAIVALLYLSVLKR
jgi:hypothetical protein